MKIFKKVSSVCAAFLCAVILTVSGAAAVYAEGEVDEALKATLVTTAEGLTDAIISFEDEQIESYLNAGDPFTVGTMTSWKTAKTELGAKTDEDAGETEFAQSGDQYTVTVPRAFEEADANFVFVFDETGVPTSATVDVQYPMSVTLQRAGLNTLMGIGTVFLMLIFLSFVISLFKYVPALVEGKKKTAPEAAPAPAVIAAAPVEEEPADDGELIAVIAAAIAASEGTSTDDFVVRSIRKVNRGRR